MCSMLKLTVLFVLFTHSCLEILTNVAWICDNFGNNFLIKHTFANYLKESFIWGYDKHLLCKFFLIVIFVRGISPKYSGGFSCYRHERGKRVRVFTHSLLKPMKWCLSKNVLTIKQNRLVSPIYDASQSFSLRFPYHWIPDFGLHFDV